MTSDCEFRRRAADRWIGHAKDVTLYIWKRLLHVAVGICTVFVGAILYDTWMVNESEILQMLDGGAEGRLNADDMLIVNYTGGFVMSRSMSGDYHRRVTCVCAKTGMVEEWDASPVRREYAEGVHKPVHRIIVTPLHMPYGARCNLNVSVIWRNGRFAMTPKLRELDSYDFEVKPRSPQ